MCEPIFIMLTGEGKVQKLQKKLEKYSGFKGIHTLFYLIYLFATYTHNYSYLHQSKIIITIMSLHKNLLLIQMKLQFRVIYKWCSKEAQQKLEAYQTWVPHTM